MRYGLASHATTKLAISKMSSARKAVRKTAWFQLLVVLSMVDENGGCVLVIASVETSA